MNREIRKQAMADVAQIKSAFEKLKLFGRKVGMTHIFTDDGLFVPVTLLEVGPCFVTQVKTKEKDGYDAVQLGYGAIKEKRLKKPQIGHFKKAGVTPLRILREVKLRKQDLGLKTGDVLTVSLFEGVKTVDVAGISKGRGFAGRIKRWGFARGPATHGSQNERRSGAIGASALPGRVWPGKKMAGHMGAQRVMVKNLKVIELIPEENLLVVKGAVPGPNGGLVEIAQGRK